MENSYYFKIYSEYDGYEVELRLKTTDDIVTRFRWNHNDSESGVGGEKAFGKLLKRMGFDVYLEEVY